MSLPQDLKARVLAAAQQQPSPTRRTTRAHAWLVLPSAVIVAATLYFSFDGPKHGQGRATWFYAASVIGWAAVAALSTWGALARGGASTGRPRAWLLALALGTPAALFAMMFLFGAIFPEVTLVHPERLGLKCLGLSLAAGAFPLVALAVVRRGSDPVHPIVSGAALGAACGASAGIMVEMWCPVAAPRHVAVGHIAPILALAVVGALLGARVLAIRGKRPHA